MAAARDSFRRSFNRRLRYDREKRDTKNIVTSGKMCEHSRPKGSVFGADQPNRKALIVSLPRPGSGEKSSPVGIRAQWSK